MTTLELSTKTEKPAKSMSVQEMSICQFGERKSAPESVAHLLHKRVGCACSSESGGGSLWAVRSGCPSSEARCEGRSGVRSGADLWFGFTFSTWATLGGGDLEPSSGPDFGVWSETQLSGCDLWCDLGSGYPFWGPNVNRVLGPVLVSQTLSDLGRFPGSLTDQPQSNSLGCGSLPKLFD